MNLDFIAGLIDADGSLGLTIQTTQSKVTGSLQYRRMLVLDITSKDKTVLEQVKNFLSFDNVVKVGSAFAYRVNSYRNMHKVIKLFENRFHGSAKIEMPLFKEALYLCQTDKSKLGFIKFIHLMYASNTQGQARKQPINYWLTIFNGVYMPDYVNKVTSNNAIPSLTINGSYVSGYTQGDGSFNLSTKKRLQVNFTLTDIEKNVLLKIQDFLQLGTSCVMPINPKTAKNNKVCYRLQLDRTEKAVKYILPHFNTFPVIGNQSKRYVLYKQACLLLSVKSTNYKASFTEIAIRFKNLKEE